MIISDERGQRFIAMLLVSPDTVIKAVGGECEFGIPGRHKLIFRSVVSLRRLGVDCRGLHLLQALDSSGLLEEVGGIRYVLELCELSYELRDAADPAAWLTSHLEL